MNTPVVSVRELAEAGEAELTTGPFGTQLKASEYLSDGIPVINVRNVGFGEIRSGADLEYIGRETAERLSRHLLQRGDIVFGRKGAVERHAYVAERNEGWLQGSDCLRLRLKSPRLLSRFASYCLLTERHKAWMQNQCSHGATMASLNQDIILRIELPMPPIQAQRKIAAILSAYDDLIETNNRRIRLLEEMAQCIYREWFVDFRYPGHEPIQLEDSALGSIPQGWTVHTISEIASRERYAVTGGPFGSKLGTKDYRDRGVPVIRGTNLAVGGGFRDSDFVFVSDAKADSMRSCLAHRGDILVTQRGTLGQVGLIPPSARFDRYLLSQSQMKITVDPEMGSGQYLYAALRSPEVTARLLGHAMTAGVPHINLSLLRNFEVVWPERTLQERFDRAVHPLGEQVENLTRSVENARATRSLLLPCLVSGAIDVTELDIEVPEAAA